MTMGSGYYQRARQMYTEERMERLRVLRLRLQIQPPPVDNGQAVAAPQGEDAIEVAEDEAQPQDNGDEPDVAMGPAAAPEDPEPEGDA